MSQRLQLLQEYFGTQNLSYYCTHYPCVFYMVESRVLQIKVNNNNNNNHIHMKMIP